jgi:hypothetical protein
MGHTGGFAVNRCAVLRCAAAFGDIEPARAANGIQQNLPDVRR